MRGTVKIIGPRWCQNHDYARSEAEGIVIKSSQYLFYIPNEKKNAKFESLFFILTEFLPN